MQSPNVLLIIWDACRLDAAREHAPTLAALADDNLMFENAITPGGYSLPSHTSMVTGTYPSEHGTYSQDHTIAETPLLAALGEDEYTRYGVSANGFASAMYGFDREFDRFYNTQAQMRYPEGLDVHAYARQVRELEDSSAEFFDVRMLTRAIRNHDHPLKSLANVATAGLTETVRDSPLLQRIPHPRFDTYSEFCYDPEKNTRTITSIFDQEKSSRTPFFIFTNYMDPHHPYAPPRRYRQVYCGRSVPYRELSNLADRTHPLQHLRNHRQGNELSDEDRQTVRNLYAGEVRTADDHLRLLLQALEQRGLRENTLIIVTADHGENLGETDRMGETRFGHVCSASDHLLRVPLVVAHPELDGQTIERHVSLKDLYGLIKNPIPLLDSTGKDLGGLEPDEVVSGQVPANGTSTLRKRYPDLVDLLDRHLVASYVGEWKVVESSSGEKRAWNGEDERDPSQAPEQALEACREHLDGLENPQTVDRDLSKTDLSHLEALGYL